MSEPSRLRPALLMVLSLGLLPLKVLAADIVGWWL